ncbi:DUF695 domain-containing protein [Thalassotalea sp. PS06]|uniref:DUF695 domain-containing protein n=1 Tax=Thalassotalea sp. PS06 TaxID=2594005 RepID=UPI0011641C4D|nr:DUF695 domain-containing protein [Thalassotalea sp. PS06]QDP01299.1 DUF695 domain-containing protein [Thalassotalea sp. PS06]
MFLFRIILILIAIQSNALAENLYFTAQGEQGGQPVIYRSMQDVPEGARESDYPTLVNIYWGYDNSENNGMPDSETNDKQIAFEDAISSLDSTGISHLMLVITGNGRKEWVWYVKDPAIWMSKFNQLLSSHQIYPIEIEIQKDPQWSTYHDFITGVSGL